MCPTVAVGNVFLVDGLVVGIVLLQRLHVLVVAAYDRLRVALFRAGAVVRDVQGIGSRRLRELEAFIADIRHILPLAHFRPVRHALTLEGVRGVPV